VGGENVIANNLIYDFNGTGDQFGFYNSGSNGAYYYYNSISLDNQATSADPAYGLYQTTLATNVKYINNMVSVTRAGTGSNYNIYLATTTSTVEADYNVYHNSLDANDYVGRYGTADFALLTDWQTANTNAYDQNSTFANPQFANIGTGDLTPTNGLANDKGSPISITTDFFGTARNGTIPDAGAIEFDVLGSDAAIAYVSPVPPLSAGSYPITVNISNVASANINSVSLTYTDGVTTVSETFGSLNLLPSTNQNLVFTTPYNISSFTTLRVFIDAVDGQSDINQGNDTVSQSLCATLAGVYTINQTLPTGSGNFSSFNAAVNAMILCGVSGPVTFNVTAGTGPYNEQVIISAIPGVSAINTVTFNGNGNEISFDALSADRYVIQLNGAKHYTFDNLVVKSLDLTYGWGFHFINAADSNTITNCTIDISSVTSTTQSNSVGIVASNSNTSVLSGADNANFLIIKGNTVIGGYQSIYFYATSTKKLIGNVIENNTLRDFYSYGIYMNYSDSAVVRGNDISRPTRTAFGTFYGIYLSTSCENVLMEKNRIHNPSAGDLAATDGKYGVYITGSDAPVGKENRVINNLIYNFNGGGVAYGFYNSSSNGSHYYHNTVSLDDQAVTTTSATYGFYQITAATNVKFFNNIISLTRNPAGTGSKWAIYFSTTTGTIDYQSNNNVLYVSNAATYNVGRWSTDFATLAAWQTANGGAFDQNSRGNNPNFIDPGNFDFTPNSSLVNNVGTPLGITDDINGQPRDLVLPDAGAIEFSVPGLDAGITLSSPSLPLSLGNQNVSVLTQNTQTTTITSVRLIYTDGVTTVSETFTGLNLATGDTTTLNFATPYNFASNVNFTVYIDSVNNLVDDDQANDTVRLTLCSSLAGIYTIDSAQAISATNYHSFQAIATDLANCGISAPVTVQMATDTFTEQVVFSYVPGSSSVNRITFESASGDSTQSVLSFGASSATAFNYVIQLNGADYFTFRSMTISRIGTNQTYSRVVEILSESDYNIFTNNVLAGPTGSTSTTTTLNRTTVAYLSSKNDYNTFTNNYFYGNSNGIWSEFTVSAPKSMVTTISNNRFENYYTGIFITAQVAPVITNNYLTRTNSSATSAYFGISVNFVDSTISILKNKVFALNGGQNAIRLRTTVCNPLTPGLVANNFAQTGGTGTSQGLSLEDNCENVNVYHNNVLVTGTSATLGRALNIAGTAPVNLNFVNNVFANIGGGYAYYIPTASLAGVNVSDYNDLYSSGANIGFWGVAQATLADFQTASGKEANSVSADPLYDATDDLHVKGISLNNTATPLAEVTDDIDGETRSLTTPDIGADEFVPSIKDMTATGIVSPNGKDCGTVNTALSVVITNVGNIADDSVTVTVFVAGALVDTFSTLVTTLVSPGVNDTIDLGFIDTYNGGTYDFTVFTSFAGDFDVTNDTLFTSVTVNAIPADAVLVDDVDSVCFNSPATFVVDNPTADFYKWFDASIGGNQIGAGTTYTSSLLTANDTFYVEASTQLTERVGRVNAGTSSFITQTVGWGLGFTVNSSVNIDSVVIYPTGTGTITIKISDQVSNTVLYTAPTANISGPGPIQVYVGASLTPGTYKIGMSSTGISNLVRESSGNSFPYTSPSGIVSITGGSTGTGAPTSAAYYWFYDWTISVPGCVSNGRTPAYAFVDSALTTPDAQFTYSANGLAVDFNITTPAAQGTTTWDFGSGNTGNGNSASFTFSTDGTYQICADVVNPCGADNSCESITVCENLDSDFTYVYNPADSIATFTLGGTGTPTLTVWDFGDGGNSIQTNPTYKYMTGNNYNVIIYTQNLCGQRDTVTKVLSNCIPIDVDFTAVEGSIGLDFNVTTILTAGIPATISYDMGDGNTLNNISFTHTYATYGNYTITLTVTDVCGNTDVATQTVSACEDLVAGFTSSVNGVSGNDISVAFTNQSTGNGLTYDWQFSNGITSIDQNPTVVFAEGLYSATLTATNLCGETDVFVSNVEACDVLDVNFTYTAVSNGLTIDFTNTTNSGVATTLNWDFGDGNTGSGNNPSHTYAAEGFYDVTLTAVNACDDTTTVTQNINVITIGISSLGINNSISVYPNPNNGLFNVVRILSADVTTTVTIYNMLGEQVYLNSYDLVNGSNSVAIDISHFAAGVYQVQIGDKLGNKTIRLFKE
jgi:PKD repeat protein